MRVLAFDTATALTAVALQDIDDEANACLREVVDLAAVDEPAAGARPNHARRLLALVHELLERSGAGWETVDRIAVGVGPGTFTGLRIGIATAQALAASTGLPLVGVSSLRSLALGSAEEQRPVLAVLDARRGEAYLAGWGARQDPLDATPEWVPQVFSPEHLARVAAQAAERHGRPLAVGDGAVRYRLVLEGAGADVPPADSPRHRISARQHCRIAALAAPAHGHVEPDYLRAPDAELSQG
jgi:tRNA threonylcarbamoyladenosine biosynthesis protein TsaB